jgi:hypothetical protein
MTLTRVLTLEEKAANFATFQHIHEVQKRLVIAITLIMERMMLHDLTKMSDPEVKQFTDAVDRLGTAAYGSEEYKQFLRDLHPALTHHYASASHHPEHYPDGINGMNLIDLLEMLCDWMASVSRSKDGNITRSFEVNEARFNISPQLARIMKNTVPLLTPR